MFGDVKVLREWRRRSSPCKRGCRCWVLVYAGKRGWGAAPWIVGRGEI